MATSSETPLRPSAATRRGAWVIDELGPWQSIAGIVPPRFEAYARIFHPASGQELLWEGPSVRGINARAMRWADVAARESTQLHPLAQWESLLGSYQQPDSGDDGWQYHDPSLGRMPLAELAAVAAVLARHTTTPVDCLATLWEGHGELHPESAERYLSFTTERTPHLEALPTRTLHPALAEALSNPRLRLPERPSLLFELDARALTDPSWAVAAGWRDQIGHGSMTPQTLWPDDCAWFLASEIDFDSTVIGGTRALVTDLLELAASATIEALELPYDADLTSTGDTINPTPSPQP